MQIIADWASSSQQVSVVSLQFLKRRKAIMWNMSDKAADET